MIKSQLGKNGPLFTVLGLGTWAIGGPWSFGWGPQDDNQSVNTIHRALDLGMNWIDTAAVYGLGHAEEILSRALKGKRNGVFIATKCGLVWNNKRRVRNNNQPESIKQELESSLQRLNTDYIDLYQIHWPDPRTPVEESWEMMVQLRKEGKVRYIGVSNFDVPLLEKCQAIHHINSLQPPYSLLNRKAEAEILPWCRNHDVGVIAYSPMQSGLLTGNFDISIVAKDDWRRKNSYFIEPQLSKNLSFVDKLKSIAKNYNKSVAQLAISWVLMNDSVTAAIAGARHPEQVNEIVGGAGWRLEQEDIKTIEELEKAIL